MASDDASVHIEQRIACLYQSSTSELKSLIDKYRPVLYDPAILDMLEKAPKPISREKLIDAVVETTLAQSRIRKSE